MFHAKALRKRKAKLYKLLLCKFASLRETKNHVVPYLKAQGKRQAE